MTDKKFKFIKRNKKTDGEAPDKKVRFVMKPREKVGEKTREFPFSDADFETLSSLIHKKTGIFMKSHKKNMIYSRLARRLRAVGVKSFADYLVYLSGAKGEAEIAALVNAITTNLTKFFREPHHFEHVKNQVLPQSLASWHAGQNKRLRIWSAGCSSGEEPYSIAMVIDQFLKEKQISDCDAKILATDLDTNMLQHGRNGVYKRIALESLNVEQLKYFEDVVTQKDMCHISADLRQYISFKPLNLFADWPMKGPFDAIFCRNVMIYFDNKSKAMLIKRFMDYLKPGGWLYIGHSETILGVNNDLKLHGRTIYQKPI